MTTQHDSNPAPFPKGTLFMLRERLSPTPILKIILLVMQTLVFMLCAHVLDHVRRDHVVLCAHVRPEHVVACHCVVSDQCNPGNELSILGACSHVTCTAVRRRVVVVSCFEVLHTKINGAVGEPLYFTHA